MSRDDHEVGGRLYSPFVELERVSRDKSNKLVLAVNASTFEPCLEDLKPTRTPNGPEWIDEPHCLIYGVVGFTVTSDPAGGNYLNITEPALSRTLMGYVTDPTLKKNLPNLYRLMYSE